MKTLLERQDYPAGRRRRGQRPYDVGRLDAAAQMGVDVRTIERPFERRRCPRDRFDARSSPSTPAGKIWGEKKPGYYIVDARGTAGALAFNRLLAAGLQVSWLREPDRRERLSVYPAGSLVVPGVQGG